MTLRWEWHLAYRPNGSLAYKIEHELNRPWLYRAINKDGTPSMERFAWDWKCVGSEDTVVELKKLADEDYET